MPFEEDIREEYFEWLYDYVCKGRSHKTISYVKLFKLLDKIEFTYSIPNDANRASDGIDLRYRFCLYKGDNELNYILDRPCTVLEMMVALAVRCEETIMDNTGYGDRTGQWFWDMMSNLGIGMMNDEIFDEAVVEDIILTFLNRQYRPDGKGGLFYIRGCEDDLRDIEIWVQLCWYLDNFV